MDRNITTIEGSSIVDRLGPYPLFLAFIALSLGLVALIVRKRHTSQAIAHTLVAISMLGLGTTAWRLFQSYHTLAPPRWH